MAEEVIDVVSSMVPADFFSASSRAQVIVDYSLPEGTEIRTTKADAPQITWHFRTLGGVTGTNAVIGDGYLTSGCAPLVGDHA